MTPFNLPSQAEALAITYVIVGILLPSLALPTIGFRLLAKVWTCVDVG